MSSCERQIGDDGRRHAGTLPERGDDCRNRLPRRGRQEHRDHGKLPPRFGIRQLGSETVRLLDRWDEHNQRVLERHEAKASEPPEEDPGPRWAWAIQGFPLIGWIGTLAIAVVWWRRRRAGR